MTILQITVRERTSGVGGYSLARLASTSPECERMGRDASITDRRPGITED